MLFSLFKYIKLSLFYLPLIISQPSLTPTCDTNSDCYVCDPEADIKRQLLDGYSQGTRPHLHYPLQVEVQLHVMHLYDVNFEDQTFKITGYLRQYWNDERLHYNISILPIDKDYITFGKSNGLWVPDSFLSNSIVHNDRVSFSNDAHRAYHFIRVYPSGDVLYSQMIDAKLNSEMNLEWFPYHIVHPNIIIESYGNSPEDMYYSLPNDKNPLTFEKRTLNMPAFTVNTDVDFSNATIVEYDTGNFSIVSHHFCLIPSRLKNILTIFIPINLLILINWLGFWMPVTKMFVHRLTLGITALLADFALSFSLPIPISSHFMWINMYILVSYFMIAMSLWESFRENKYVAHRFPELLGENTCVNEVTHTQTEPINSSNRGNQTQENISPEATRNKNRRKRSPVVTPDEISVDIENTIVATRRRNGIQESPIIPSTLNPLSNIKYQVRSCFWDYFSLKRWKRRQITQQDIKKAQNDGTELLYQPFITPRRRLIRALYLIIWIGVNATLIGYGEYSIEYGCDKDLIID